MEVGRQGSYQRYDIIYQEYKRDLKKYEDSKIWGEKVEVYVNGIIDWTPKQGSGLFLESYI